MPRPLAIALLLLPPACGLACDAAPAQPAGPAVAVNAGLPTAALKIGNATFTLEIADTPAAEEIGLMNRDALPPGRGMIFLFDREEPRNFWMKNTRIPLDILFLDKAGKVVSVGHMKPFDLSKTPSGGPAMYAVELNAGAAAKAGVRPGDLIDLGPITAATSGKK